MPVFQTMSNDRFTLLLLDPNEILFDDFGCTYYPETCTEARNAAILSLEQNGRLKLCSKSLLFNPNEFGYPLFKVMFKHITQIEKRKTNATWYLQIKCEKYSQMLQHNIIAPYKSAGKGFFRFIFEYTKIDDFLPLMKQLYDAALLSPSDHDKLVAEMVVKQYENTRFNRFYMNINERIQYELRASRVSPLVVNPGLIALTEHNLYFQPFNNVEEETVIQVPLILITVILKRRFLLKPIGLEIHWSKKSIYLMMENEKSCDQLYQSLCKLHSNPKSIEPEKLDILTYKWINGTISNYDYLVNLNSLADRTKIDLTQYPVFPWIIADYESAALDLQDERTFRDLSKPIGALNDERLTKLLERFRDMPDDEQFLYGTHYSTPGFVLFYLARQYPKYVLCMQNGCFDMPDRMFNSVAEVYRNCLKNGSDFKELIPEFYDLDEKGEFLVNVFHVDFGQRYNGKRVGDVELPKWAKNPEDFVLKMRQALESDFVSDRLHLWIDLIFGYKQRGPEALKAHNLFHPICYEGTVDLDKITDPSQKHALRVQIMEFGQIPKQLFTSPHPKKIRHFRPEPEIDAYDWNTRNERLDLAFERSIPVSAIDNDRKIEHFLIATATTTTTDDANNDRLVYVTDGGSLKLIHEIGKGGCALASGSTIIRKHMICESRLASIVSLNARNLFALGAHDNIVHLFDLEAGQVVETLNAHTDTVGCLAWAAKRQLLASGSFDALVIVWGSLLDETTGRVSRHYEIVAKFDHDSKITALAFDEHKNMYLAVGIDDGTITVWNMINKMQHRQIKTHRGEITRLQIGGVRSLCLDGFVISTSVDGSFWAHDVCTATVVSGTQLPFFIRYYATAFVFCRDTFVVMGTSNGNLYVWDLVRSKFIARIEGRCSQPVRSMQLCPRHEFLFVSHSAELFVWRIHFLTKD